MSHGLKPSVQHGGGVVPPTTTAQAYLIEYQTVTSHGNEAVSDGTIKTNINHSTGVAILSPPNWDTNDSSTQKGRVHVPIHNPPGITKGWNLQDISVNFEGENDASVSTIKLLYDGQVAVSINTNTDSTFNIVFTQDEGEKYAYFRPTGISLTLDLKFPEKDSDIKLYSVTLLYKAT